MQCWAEAFLLGCFLDLLGFYSSITTPQEASLPLILSAPSQSAPNCFLTSVLKALEAKGQFCTWLQRMLTSCSEFVSASVCTQAYIVLLSARSMVSSCTRSSSGCLWAKASSPKSGWALEQDAQEISGVTVPGAIQGMWSWICAVFPYIFTSGLCGQESSNRKDLSFFSFHSNCSLVWCGKTIHVLLESRFGLTFLPVL